MMRILVQMIIFKGKVVRTIQWRNQVQLKSQRYSKMQLKHLLLQLTLLMMKQHIQLLQVQIFAHKMRLQGLLMILLTI